MIYILYCIVGPYVEIIIEKVPVIYIILHCLSLWFKLYYTVGHCSLHYIALLVPTTDLWLGTKSAI